MVSGIFSWLFVVGCTGKVCFGVIAGGYPGKVRFGVINRLQWAIRLGLGLD